MKTSTVFYISLIVIWLGLFGFSLATDMASNAEQWGAVLGSTLILGAIGGGIVAGIYAVIKKARGGKQAVSAA